ncbi:recombinase family protein [Brevibacillus sp. JB24b]|uniref:recombinase family protein n=1 Tax=Brevibacillus sp. JB24b TaxID=3422308 RepID=UPI003F6894E7
MSLKREYLIELGIENIINYLRRSRQDEERERRTGEDVLKEQKEIMDRILEPLGIPFTQKAEVGSGDKISTRPVFQNVIEELRAKKYQAIAVKEISRMGRGSYTDMGIIYDLIVDNRIFIITPYKTYDPRNTSDLRQIRFELFMSREEFETTRERLFGGRVNNAMAGRWVSGAAPFGFNYNKTTKKLEINEEQAAVVRMIFNHYVYGIPQENGTRRDVSFRALATYFSKKTPIKTPQGKREWTYMQLRQLITNERYIGTMKFRMHQTINGKRVARPEEEHIIVPNAIPAIIDMETWELAQQKVKDSSHKPRTKMDFSPCELAGLCICIQCGKRMVRQYSVQNYKTKEGTITTYHKEFLWCTTSGCTFVKYRAIEDDLLETLRYFEAMEDNLLKEEISTMITQDNKTNSNDLIEDIAGYIEQRTKELKNRLSFIYDKYENGIYTDEMFLERKAEIDMEMEKLKDIKENQPAENNEQNFDAQIIKKNIGSILEAYKTYTNKTDRNGVLRSVFDHVVIEVVEKGRGRKPAKHVIYPVLKHNLLQVDFLVP